MKGARAFDGKTASASLIFEGRPRVAPRPRDRGPVRIPIIHLHFGDVRKSVSRVMEKFGVPGCAVCAIFVMTNKYKI